MTTSRLTDSMAPIEYSGMSRVHQAARALGAVGVGLLGVLGLVWGDPQAIILVVAAAVEFAHAAYRIRVPPTSALGSLIADTTFFGAMLLVADLVPAQFAVAAYLLIASMLLLSLAEAALVIAYGALWAALVANLAPISSASALAARHGVSIGRAAGVLFLILIAILLFTASRFLHSFRRRQEAALATERRAGSLKDQFVSMVSHEFRTPLTSIAGFTEMLRDARSNLTDEEVDEFLNIIYTEARHLSNLVEDVLVIPRLEADRMPFTPKDFDLASQVKAVVEVIFPPGGPHDAVVAIAGGVIVNADANRVAQVLRNLLQNALKYGGDQILVEGAHRGERYEVVVSDNGPGVPIEHRDRIFEHFEQVSRGDARTDSGIGLGLPIASRLVQAMGGELWHEPRFPTGSRFCFTLPLGGRTASAAIEGVAAGG